MGFIEGLLLSFIAGWVNSYLYRKYLRSHNKDWIVFQALIFLFILWTIDLLIYFEIIDMRWLNFLPWVNIPSMGKGTYFLWNSFLVFGVNFKIVNQSGMEVIGFFLLVSYLFWYYLGSKLGKVFHGYKTYQQGHYLIYRPVKKFIKDREKRTESTNS
ncbi:MAG: hypothetical protein ACFFCI_00890 [Promethearchaeota archaeon]